MAWHRGRRNQGPSLGTAYNPKLSKLPSLKDLAVSVPAGNYFSVCVGGMGGACARARLCVCVCVCVCEHVCGWACEHVCMCACVGVRACVRACECVCVNLCYFSH